VNVRGDSPRPLTTHAKLLFVAATWGAAWAAGRWLALDIPPVTGAWLRYAIAVPLFIIWLEWRNELRIPNQKEWFQIASIGFFGAFLYQVLFMFGMRWTAAGDASLVITFNPLFTAILAIPFLGEKMTPRLMGGIVLGILGIAVIANKSPNIDLPLNERLWGDALIAGGAFAWACSTIFMKKALDVGDESGQNAMTPLELTAWASLIGLVLLTPWASWETIQFGIPVISQITWVSILFLAVISTVISYVWFADGVRDIGAAQAALYVYLVPLFGIFFGWLLLGEKFGWSLLVSFALIVSGVTLASSDGNGRDFKRTEN